ncbi:MAG: hypothetical protein ACYCSR_04110 [Thiomonas sp.]
MPCNALWHKKKPQSPRFSLTSSAPEFGSSRPKMGSIESAGHGATCSKACGAFVSNGDSFSIHATNTQDLLPAEVSQRHKHLTGIERGSRVLKSEIEIAPVFRRLPEHILVHALICCSGPVPRHDAELGRPSVGARFDPCSSSIVGLVGLEA